MDKENNTLASFKQDVATFLFSNDPALMILYSKLIFALVKSLFLIADASDINSQEIYEFEPLINSWSQIGVFPGLGRVYSSLNFFNGSLIVLAGLDSIGNSYNDMWQFNLTTLGWQQLASIPAVERRGGMCFNSGSSFYYTTGINQTNTRLKETWKIINPTSIYKNELRWNEVYYK